MSSSNPSDILPPVSHPEHGSMYFDIAENVYKVYIDGAWTTVTYQYSGSSANPATPYVEQPIQTIEDMLTDVMLSAPSSVTDDLTIQDTGPSISLTAEGICIDNKPVITWEQLAFLSNTEKLIKTISDQVLEHLCNKNTKELLRALQAKVDKDKAKRFIDIMEEYHEDNGST